MYFCAFWGYAEQNKKTLKFAETGKRSADKNYFYSKLEIK
jgi:hypothetical protein